MMGRRKPKMSTLTFDLEVGDHQWLETYAAERGISVERYLQRLIDLAHRQEKRRRETASRYVLKEGD
jgi:hypothetical protein